MKKAALLKTKIDKIHALDFAVRAAKAAESISREIDSPGGSL